MRRSCFFASCVVYCKIRYIFSEEGRAARVCTPAPAHRIQPAGRRVPDRAADGAAGGAGHEALRHHGSRRDVRRGGFLSEGAQARHPSGHRLRGVRLPEHGREEQRAPRVQPPDSAVREPDGVSEPDQAGVRGLHAGLLLSPAGGLRPAAPAQRGPDLLLRMPVRRSAQAALGGARGGGAADGAGISGHLRPRQLLRGDSGSRPAGGAAGAGRAGAAGAQHGHSAGGHQRLPLPAARGRRGPGGADVYPDGQDAERRQPDAHGDRPALCEIRGGDARAVPAVPRRIGEHGEDR